jgi:hypothetical protein
MHSLNQIKQNIMHAIAFPITVCLIGPSHGFIKSTDQFPIQGCAISCKFNEISGICWDKVRTMVTRNREDFITLTVQFFEKLKPHCGLIIVPYTMSGHEFGKLSSLLKNYSKNHPIGLGSWKQIIPQYGAKCGFVAKAHIGICAGGWNAGDGATGKQDVELFFSRALRSSHS